MYIPWWGLALMVALFVLLAVSREESNLKERVDDLEQRIENLEGKNESGEDAY